MESASRISGAIAFVQAARHGSFTAAARALGVTPAAISKSVAALESSLGVRLMNRTTRSLSLTAEGTQFLAQARTALDTLDQAMENLTSSPANPVGLVRMSVPNVIGRRLIMPVLPALLERHAALSVEVDFDDRVVDFVQEGYDLVVRGGNVQDSSMIALPLGPLRLGLIAAPAYLDKHGVPRQPQELSQHRLISRRFLAGRLSPWKFHQSDGEVYLHEPTPAALTLSDPESLLQAALSGVGIAEVGIYLALPHLLRGELKLILHDSHDPGAFQLMLQYPHRSFLAPRVRATADFLTEALRANKDLQVSPETLRQYAA